MAYDHHTLCLLRFPTRRGGEEGGAVEVIQMHDTIYPFVVDGDKVVVLERLFPPPLSLLLFFFIF